MNPPVAWPVQQVIAQQVLDFGHEVWLGGRVQSMAAIIEPLSTGLEAARVAANYRVLFDDGDSGALPVAQLIGGADAGWPGARITM